MASDACFTEKDVGPTKSTIEGQNSKVDNVTVPANDLYTATEDVEKSAEPAGKSPLSKLHLDIDPLPVEIVEKIIVHGSLRTAEKDGQLLLPLTCLFSCTWEDVPIELEEKDDIWAGTTIEEPTLWVNSSIGDRYTIPVAQAFINKLQGKEGFESACKALTFASGTEYSNEKARTLGRYVASVVNGGDNHITLLTAAYCVIFDRLWW